MNENLLSRNKEANGMFSENYELSHDCCGDGNCWLPPWRVNEEPPLESAILGCALFLIGLSVSENHAGETPWSLAVGMI